MFVQWLTRRVQFRWVPPIYSALLPKAGYCLQNGIHASGPAPGVEAVLPGGTSSGPSHQAQHTGL